jgi:hypothetical protein
MSACKGTTPTWMRAVLTMPGDTQLTVTPRSAHSAARLCVSLTTAASEHMSINQHMRWVPRVCGMSCCCK